MSREQVLALRDSIKHAKIYKRMPEQKVLNEIVVHINEYLHRENPSFGALNEIIVACFEYFISTLNVLANDDQFYVNTAGKFIAGLRLAQNEKHEAAALLPQRISASIEAYQYKDLGADNNFLCLRRSTIAFIYIDKYFQLFLDGEERLNDNSLSGKAKYKLAQIFANHPWTTDNSDTSGALNYMINQQTPGSIRREIINCRAAIQKTAVFSILHTEAVIAQIYHEAQIYSRTDKYKDASNIENIAVVDSILAIPPPDKQNNEHQLISMLLQIVQFRLQYLLSDDKGNKGFYRDYLLPYVFSISVSLTISDRNLMLLKENISQVIDQNYGDTVSEGSKNVHLFKGEFNYGKEGIRTRLVETVKYCTFAKHIEPRQRISLIFESITSWAHMLGTNVLALADLKALRKLYHAYAVVLDYSPDGTNIGVPTSIRENIIENSAVNTFDGNGMVDPFAGQSLVFAYETDKAYAAYLNRVHRHPITQDYNRALETALSQVLSWAWAFCTGKNQGSDNNADKTLSFLLTAFSPLSAAQIAAKTSRQQQAVHASKEISAWVLSDRHRDAFAKIVAYVLVCRKITTIRLDMKNIETDCDNILKFMIQNKPTRARQFELVKEFLDRYLGGYKPSADEERMLKKMFIGNEHQEPRDASPVNLGQTLLSSQAGQVAVIGGSSPAGTPSLTAKPRAAWSRNK